MSENLHFALLLLSPLVLSHVVAQYYQESSYIELKSSEASPTADFGFSLSYQNGDQPKIIVGSPHSDQVGQVYGCPIENLFEKDHQCNKLSIDVKKLASEYQLGNKNQKFCLGASIVASSEYLLTCAPLWPTLLTISTKSGYVEYSASYGTCFIYYNETKVFRYNGVLERYGKSKHKPGFDSMYGGIGWSSMLDEANNIITLSKSVSNVGDIHYLKSSRPEWQLVDSMRQTKPSRDYNVAYFNDNPDNIGYGFASGRFFYNDSTSYIAFSARDRNSNGKISFLHYIKNRHLEFVKQEHKRIEIAYKEPGSMFGAELSSGDVNADGLGDLLVGAPGHSYVDDYNSFESGALFIYLGGDMKTINERRRTVFAEKDGSRFGSSIATNDLDGDALPEIIVSAPYEHSNGALYIISGYELNEVLIKSKIREIELSDLKFTQRIYGEKFLAFGFSSKVIPDIDDNGCSELAVGAPNSASVVLLRCVPTINATLSARLVDQVVSEANKNFTVEVCVELFYNEKPHNITTQFWVVSNISGTGAAIHNAKFDVALNKKETNICKNITVLLDTNEAGVYYFSAKLETDIDTLMKNNKFEPTWVRLNPHYSKTKVDFEVSRHCPGENDCTLKLNMDILWAGRENVTQFIIDSTTKETVTVLVTNEGADAYDSCVRVRIRNAQVFSAPGDLINSEGVYRCYLPKPLRKNAQHKLNIVVFMDGATGADNNVHIEAKLYNNCNQPNYTITQRDVKLSFSSKNVYVTGYPHSFNITDTALKNMDTAVFSDRHEYLIVNNGTLNWRNIDVLVTLPKTKLIQNYTPDLLGMQIDLINILSKLKLASSSDTRVAQRISTTQNSPCYGRQKNDSLQFNCTVNLPPQEKVRVIIIVDILKDRFVEYLSDGRIEVTSQLHVLLNTNLDFVPSDSLNSTIFFVKELSIKNNKTLLIALGVFGAIIILGVLAFILYKLGFFERKEKQRLETFKESVRKQSIKPSTSGETKDESKEDINMEVFNMEVVDDCPFEIIEPMSDADNELLIEPTTPEEKPSTSQGGDQTKMCT